MVPPSRCKAMKDGKPGLDFMTADASPGQALQVMTQKRLGGNIFGVTCSLGGGQSEHVAFYMPEMTALSLFLTDENNPQIETPAWVLGARPVFDVKDAALWSNQIPGPFPGLRFTSDLIQVQVASTTFNVSSAKPVVAFSGETQDHLGMSLSAKDMHLARTNRLAKCLSRLSQSIFLRPWNPLAFFVVT